MLLYLVSSSQQRIWETRVGVARFFGAGPSRAGEEGRKSMQMKVVGQVGEVVLQSFNKYVALLSYQRLF